MPRTINVTVSDTEFERLNDIKDEFGMTWREFVVEAGSCLEDHYEDQ